jgi:hypothetical protein
MNSAFQAVVTSVNNILNDTNLETVTETVVDRLVSLGYTPTDEDTWMIAFSVKGTVNHVLNQIGHSTIPEGLVEIVVDMVCGEFLNTKFRSGQLDLSALDLDGMIQSVSQGDTSVSFNTEGSDEEKLKGLLSWLIHGKEGDLICYRKMRW